MANFSTDDFFDDVLDKKTVGLSGNDDKICKSTEIYKKDEEIVINENNDDNFKRETKKINEYDKSKDLCQSCFDENQNGEENLYEDESFHTETGTNCSEKSKDSELNFQPKVDLKADLESPTQSRSSSPTPRVTHFINGKSWKEWYAEKYEHEIKEFIKRTELNKKKNILIKRELLNKEEYSNEIEKSVHKWMEDKNKENRDRISSIRKQKSEEKELEKQREIKKQEKREKVEREVKLWLEEKKCKKKQEDKRYRYSIHC